MNVMAWTIASAAKSLAAMTGVLESVDSKIDNLAKSELRAGFLHLEQARLSENQRESLLHQARTHFNKAVGLESGLRLAFSHLGAAVCHHVLGDHTNSIHSLRKVLHVKQAESHVANVKGSLKYMLGDNPAATAARLVIDPKRLLFFLGKHVYNVVTDHEQEFKKMERCLLEKDERRISLYKIQFAVADYLSADFVNTMEYLTNEEIQDIIVRTNLQQIQKL